MRPACVLGALAYVLGCGLSLHTSAQEAAKQPDAAAPTAPKVAEPLRLNDSAVGLVTDVPLERVDKGDLLWRGQGLLFFGQDLPKDPIDGVADLMTPEMIAALSKLRNGRLVAKEMLEVDGNKAVLLRLLCAGDAGDQSVLFLLIGDERFSSALGVISRGTISDEQFPKVREMLAGARWNSDALADSLTDNLSFRLRAPRPLRFAAKKKGTVAFTDAIKGKSDLSKILFVIVQEELEPLLAQHEAYNLSRAGVFADRIANPRSPKHDEFKWREFNALTTRVHADPVMGEGERVVIVTSIFMPDRIITIEGLAPQVRADELAGMMMSMVDSIEFLAADKKPGTKGEEVFEKR